MDGDIGRASGLPEERRRTHRQREIVTRTSPVKALGFWMATALVVGNMIGAGVYLLPAALAPYGWNAIVGWILTISGGLCLAAVFAQLARALPEAGGPYAYTRAAFGPAAGFLVAWSYWISIWVGNAALATGAVSYLSVFFPEIATTQGLHAVVTCGVIVTLIAINCRGAYLAGRVQLVTTIIKILPLLAVILLVGALALGVGGLEPAAAPPPFLFAELKPAAITAAATLTLWALLGLESATVPAGKVKDPARTIPRATMTGIVIAGVLYLLTCSGIMLFLPAEEVAVSSAPFADFVSRYLDPKAGALIAGFAAISGIGALNGWILLQGELPNAMAKGGVFPRYLAKTDVRGTPVRALLISGGLLLAVVLMNYSKTMMEAFTFILLLSTTASLIMFLACALAALALQRRGVLKASPVFAVIALAAVIYAIWTIYGAGGEAVAWGVALLAAGAPVYFFVRRRNGRETAPG